MIQISNVDVYGFAAAIRGMRNSYNSWDKSDSVFDDEDGCSNMLVNIGENDMTLMETLVRGGPEHCKFRRAINVSMDILAPLYWWKQFDTYKVGTTSLSTSTMHTLMKKPIDISCFSIDKYEGGEEDYEFFVKYVEHLESMRQRYFETKDNNLEYSIIQRLPSNYNQLRTISTNAEVLYNIYGQRHTHKLPEWKIFCDFIHSIAEEYGDNG